MDSSAEQVRLFGEDGGGDGSTVFINGRCRLQTLGAQRVVTACGVAIAAYAVGDRMSEAYAMVHLIEQGMAAQSEVAHAFGCDVRTVRRHQRRFERGGLLALGRRSGYPKGRPRLTATRFEQVNEWKAEGVSNREIARRLGVSEKSVRKLARRLGWRPAAPEQRELPLSSADPNLSGLAVEPADSAEKPLPAAETSAPEDADPNLSGVGADPVAEAPADPPPSLDPDPSNRQFDRVMACLGLLDDAAPLFRSGTSVPGAGVLLAVPALVDSGTLEIADDIYGSIGPAFYGLRTTLVTLLLMALLRIKRPESLKEHSPQVLGRLLGLDRAPEVKTLRRKLVRLAGFERATEFGRALARRRVATRGHALGFLYVDGHVRAYHGKRKVPKTHVARIRLSMPATTDYWVNDAEGEPLFVVTAEANQGLVKMLPDVLDEVRSLVGERRVTVVFDRGGWSPKLFRKLIASGFDILTYRKGRFRRVPKKKFSKHEATIEGRKVSYVLADQNVLLDRRKLKLRQVTRLSDNGHQTPVLTSRWDLDTIEIAYRMFERWRQENFFKYLREEYALDALVDYDADPADPDRTVPNPRRKQLNAELRKLYVEANQILAEYGAEAFDNAESLRRTMRGFKIANVEISRRFTDLVARIRKLEKRRGSVPTRVPVAQVTEGEVIKLAVERKHLTNLLKMVAYQAESDLVRLVTPHYRRAEDEGRTLIQSALAANGDIEVIDDQLRVHFEPLSSPHRTYALAELCESLNATKTRFPGSKLRLRFDVKPPPDRSLAFPGARPKEPAEGAQPDNSGGG